LWRKSDDTSGRKVISSMENKAFRLKEMELIFEFTEPRLKDVITGREAPSEIEIRYIVFGGADNRIDKRLHIFGNGWVKYSTIGDDLKVPIEEKGEYSFRLSEKEIIELLKCFDENDFLKMRQEEKLEPNSVYSEICLRIGGQEHCVYYYHEEDMQERYKIVKPPEYRKIEEKLMEIIARAKKP